MLKQYYPRWFLAIFGLAILLGLAIPLLIHIELGPVLYLRIMLTPPAQLRKIVAHSSNASHRAEAAARLGKLRDTQSVPTLVKALADTDTTVRSNAAWALGQIGNGDPSVSHALTDLLLHGDKDNQLYATQALQSVRQLRGFKP
jgi:HEAT repeat protein